MRPRDPAVILVALAYGAIAASFDAYTWPIRVATALPIFAITVRTLAAGAPRPAASYRGWGYMVWFVVIAVVLGFQLGMYFSTPRASYPTFSSLAESAFRVPVLRALAFAAWLWAGIALTARASSR